MIIKILFKKLCIASISASVMIHIQIAAMERPPQPPTSQSKHISHEFIESLKKGKTPPGIYISLEKQALRQKQKARNNVAYNFAQELAKFAADI